LNINQIRKAMNSSHRGASATWASSVSLIAAPLAANCTPVPIARAATNTQNTAEPGR
jgi:transcription initiation factor TFIID subunit TAF12